MFVLIIIAVIAMGIGFGFKTIWCILISSLIMGILSKQEALHAIPGSFFYMQERLLIPVVAGVFEAVGLGLVLRYGGSTGGTDIIALMVNKYWPVSLSTVFLINRKYVPFYKWAFRAVKQLPLMGMSIAEKLEHLVSLPLMETMPEAVAEPVEGICQEIADHLQSEGLLDSNDPWLFAQGPVIQAHIENNALRSMPPQLE